jgi:microcystin-dependent protein
MATPYLGEIVIVPYTFAPRGFAFCDGQILPISQNTALFSLLGTTYGGNGTTNFALPDLQGRTPLSSGQGPGLTDRGLGESAGEVSVTLLAQEMPAHNHALSVSTDNADRSNATGNYFAVPPDPTYVQQAGAGVGVTAGAVPIAGGGQPHNNRSPYLVLNFVIALQGIFPARN